MSVLAADQIPSTVPQYKKVTLTANQVKNLVATPIEIVPAPGAGLYIFPLQATATIHSTGHTAYSTAGATGANDLTLFVGTGSAIQAICDKTLVTETDDRVRTFATSSLLGDLNFAPADVENLSLTVNNPAPADEYSLGDALIDIEVMYIIKALS